ncbi:metallophosphoesterase [Tissierella creatinini]|nr:metallophosphoesterase [Tissierella creatinini]TJX62923.1 metallophosphoesterase [Soehngenia saccharolytica]
MRVIVVSDTHRSISNFLEKVKTMDKPDLILHLGDYTNDGDRIEEDLGINVIKVKGNGDFASIYNEDEILEIRGKRVFLTHGHNYGVYYSNDRLYYKGLEVEADIVLYGHTHIPEIIQEENMIIMNPGSPTRPRGRDMKPTFGLLEITDKIVASIVEI